MRPFAPSGLESFTCLRYAASDCLNTRPMSIEWNLYCAKVFTNDMPISIAASWKQIHAMSS